MRRVVYPAVLDDSQNGEKEYYTVEFPDVDGAFSEGHGLAEALYNAEQALGLALYDVPDEDLPVPSKVEDIEQFCKENYPNAKVYPVVSDLDEAARKVGLKLVKQN